MFCIWVYSTMLIIFCSWIKPVNFFFFSGNHFQCTSKMLSQTVFFPFFGLTNKAVLFSYDKISFCSNGVRSEETWAPWYGTVSPVQILLVLLTSIYTHTAHNPGVGLTVRAMNLNMLHMFENIHTIEVSLVSVAWPRFVLLTGGVIRSSNSQMVLILSEPVLYQALWEKDSLFTHGGNWVSLDLLPSCFGKKERKLKM